MSFLKTQKSKALQFTLTVPKIDSFNNPRTITTPAQLESWLNDLPLANRNIAVKEILDTIHLINRHPGKIQHRTELIDKFDNSYEILSKIAVDLSKKQVISTLSKKDNEFLENFYKLNQELGYAYKKVINQELSTGLFKKVPTYPFYKAMQLLKMDMVLAFCFLKKNQNIIWTEILKIFQISQTLKIEKIIIQNPYTGEKYYSITNILKQVILLQLVDPHRMQTNEIWDSVHYIDPRSKLTILAQPTKAPLTSEQIFIDITGATSILKLSRSKKEITNNKRYLVFDLKGLIEETHRILNLLENQLNNQLPDDLKNIPAEKLQNFLKKILITWQLKPKRNSKRIEHYSQIEVLLGLTAIHTHLEQEQNPNKKYREQDSDQYIFNNAAPRPLTLSQKKQQIAYSARQTNISSQGMGGEINLTQAETVFQVGQLLLFKDKKHPEQSMLGIIRRLHPKASNILGFGVELLNGEIYNITYHIDGSPNECWVEKGVLLHTGKQTKQLITPCDTFVQNQGFSIKITDKENYFRSSKLLDTGNYFQRIEIIQDNQK